MVDDLTDCLVIQQYFQSLFETLYTNLLSSVGGACTDTNCFIPQLKVFVWKLLI